MNCENCRNFKGNGGFTERGVEQILCAKESRGWIMRYNRGIKDECVYFERSEQNNDERQLKMFTDEQTDEQTSGQTLNAPPEEEVKEFKSPGYDEEETGEEKEEGAEEGEEA